VQNASCRELAALIEKHRTEATRAGFVAKDVVDTLLAIRKTKDLSPNDLLAILVDFLNACECALAVGLLWVNQTGFGKTES
jgi:hypothetical protein